MSHNATPISPTEQAGWHVLYQAALFETDRNKIPLRIAEAETAILVRMKELFTVSSDHIEEDLILDDALYGLRALQNSLSKKRVPPSMPLD